MGFRVGIRLRREERQLIRLGVLRKRRDCDTEEPRWNATGIPELREKLSRYLQKNTIRDYWLCESAAG
jgi:hypothetical protein